MSTKYSFPGGSIFRRWVKLIKLQRVQESIPQFLLKVLLFTGIYFKLSIFQKHHAEVRVFSKHGGNGGSGEEDNERMAGR